MNRPKAKGDQWERDVVAVLCAAGLDCERMLGLGRHRDDGDIRLHGFHLEAKNHRAWDLAGWMDEAKREAGSNVAMVILKRRGKSPAQGYAVMELGTLAQLIAQGQL